MSMKDDLNTDIYEDDRKGFYERLHLQQAGYTTWVHVHITVGISLA